MQFGFDMDVGQPRMQSAAVSPNHRSSNSVRAAAKLLSQAPVVTSNFISSLSFFFSSFHRDWQLYRSTPHRE